MTDRSQQDGATPPEGAEDQVQDLEPGVDAGDVEQVKGGIIVQGGISPNTAINTVGIKQTSFTDLSAPTTRSV